MVFSVGEAGPLSTEVDHPELAGIYAIVAPGRAAMAFCAFAARPHLAWIL